LGLNKVTAKGAKVVALALARYSPAAEMKILQLTNEEAECARIT
jgi:hypothetical protein